MKKDENVKVNFIDQKTARQKTNNGWLELQLKSNVWSLKNSLNEQKKTFDLTLIIFKHFVCIHYIKAKVEHAYNLSNSYICSLLHCVIQNSFYFSINHDLQYWIIKYLPNMRKFFQTFQWVVWVCKDRLFNFKWTSGKRTHWWLARCSILECEQGIDVTYGLYFHA